MMLNNQQYNQWISQKEPTEQELFRQSMIKFPTNPKISIIVPTFNTPRKYLVEMIHSVIHQTYKNWELCIADGSTNKDTIKTLKDYERKYKQIKVTYLDKNLQITKNSIEAVKLATGDYITFLDHDDTLAKFALFEVVRAIHDNYSPEMIYSDEDKIIDNLRAFPFFKPIWSPDTLRSCNYICHLSVYQRDFYDSIGGLREGFDGSQDYDLILRATEKATNIVHIPKILYHWRMTKDSTSQNPESKEYAFENAKKALTEHLERVGLKGKVTDGKFKGSYHITYELLEPLPLVSIIIPNQNNYELLKQCIESILTKTTYKNYEIVIVENGSTQKEVLNYYDSIKKNKQIKIIKWEEQTFNFSKINNYAVSKCKGEYLLFLNNDTKVINNDWLSEMMQYIIREDVGIVGAKLYYEDGSLQHVGVATRIGNTEGPFHPYCKHPGNASGAVGKTIIVQNLSAVTGACLLTKRKIFEEVSGFDENLVLAFNDIMLCLDVLDKGYRIVWTPFTELFHYESKTRGYEDTPEKQARCQKEHQYLMNKYRHKYFMKGDNYYGRGI